MKPITEETKKQLVNGEMIASVCVSADYFEEGDYTEWKEQDEETAAMTYEEYQKHLVAEMQETYECIWLNSDGTLYGIENGTRSIQPLLSYHFRHEIPAESTALRSDTGTTERDHA